MLVKYGITDTSDPGHFGTSLVGPNCPDRSALVPKCPRQFGPKCRTVLPQVPNCPAPSAEVSWPVFDDYGVTDPKARLTETAHGELRLKVEQL